MSSYLNKQAPPPPPPKAPTSTPNSSTSSSSLPTSSEPTRTKPNHRHKQSIHYNDAPDLAALAETSAGGGGVNRTRSTRVSRVPALPSLQSTPSTSGTTTPFNARASAEKDELALPAFNAPPLQAAPPLPQSSIRTGPRSLPYDVLHYPPPSLTTKLLILFIPGNPGLVDYYRSFLSTLQSTLPPSTRDETELYAIGHLGHSLEAESKGMIKGFKPSEQATLEEQVTSKCEFVDELVGRHGKEVKIMILGHSIGSWICLQMLRSRPFITSAHLLFPTISHMSLTPNGRKLSPLFNSWTLRPLFYSTSFLSYLPSSLTSTLVSLLTGQSGPTSLVTTTQLVSSPQTVVAALTMAKKEMEGVKELDVELIKEVGDKCWWYWSREGGDGWVREECVEEIESVLGEELRSRRTRCEEGMLHAFVLNQDHSDSLARECAGWIVKDLEVDE